MEVARSPAATAAPAAPSPLRRPGAAPQDDVESIMRASEKGMERLHLLTGAIVKKLRAAEARAAALLQQNRRLTDANRQLAERAVAAEQQLADLRTAEPPQQPQEPQKTE